MKIEKLHEMCHKHLIFCGSEFLEIFESFLVSRTE